MRETKAQQIFLGEVNISDLDIDVKSRDELPKLLLGLQYIYVNKEIRDEVFEILSKDLIKTDINNGRPGMHLWTIFCLGAVRLILNADYDRLHDLANKHITIREMLGHGQFNDFYYKLQTIKDNVKLFTPEILDKINKIVVESGHVLLKKKKKSKQE